MTTSKKVRRRVKEAHTFNAGASPIVDDLKPKKGSKVHRELMSKMTHHKIAGDGISEGGSYVGVNKKYKSKRKPSVASRVLSTFSPLAGALAGKLGETLSAHSLENFY